MGMKTQGTNMWAIDPDGDELLDVGCVMNITGIDTTIDQIETTCLSDLARTYEAGLGTPGTASFQVQFDSRTPAHIRLHQLKTAGTTLQWIIGFSDGIGIAPTVTTDSSGERVFNPPATRTWLAFEGFMNSYPFDFSQNAMVTSQIGVQISGDPVLIPKSTS